MCGRCDQVIGGKNVDDVPALAQSLNDGLADQLIPADVMRRIEISEHQNPHGLQAQPF